MCLFAYATGVTCTRRESTISIHGRTHRAHNVADSQRLGFTDTAVAVNDEYRTSHRLHTVIIYPGGYICMLVCCVVQKKGMKKGILVACDHQA